MIIFCPTPPHLPPLGDFMLDRTGRDSPSWIALRTAAARTLALEQSLIESGMLAWTPKQLFKQRRGRGQAQGESVIAITPSFVFAGSLHLYDLMAVASRKSSSHPPFTLFHFVGQIPIIPDAQLNGLRTSEGKRDRSRTFKPRQPVKVKESAGVFAGLSGVVEYGNEQHTIVDFGGYFRAKIATWQLLDEVIINAPIGNNRPTGSAAGQTGMKTGALG